MIYSASSWKDRIMCGYAHFLRHQRRLVKRAEIAPALEFGKLWHHATNSFLMDGEIVEENQLCADMLNHWSSHNLKRYPTIHDHETHGPCAWGEILYALDLHGKLVLKPLAKLPASGRCGVIDTVCFDGSTWWIIERKSTSLTDPGWPLYRATLQYYGYAAVVGELTRLTGFPCRIVYDVARKSAPKAPKGLVCGKCHGANPACPQCFGTNVIGIAKSVTDTDEATVIAWLARHPHVIGAEFIDQIRAAGERFNWWFSDSPEDRVEAIRVHNQLMCTMRCVRPSTVRTFVGCNDCQFLIACRDPTLEPFSLTRDPEIDPTKPRNLPAECAFKNLNPLTVGEAVNMIFPQVAKARKALKS